MIYTIKKKKESTNIPLKFNISIPKALGEPFRERNFYSPWIFYRFLFKILFKKKKTEKEKKIKGFSRDSDQKYFINSRVLRHFKGVIKLPPTVSLIRDIFVLRSLAKKAAGFRVSNIWERSKRRCMQMTREAVYKSWLWMGFVLLLSYSYFDKPRARTCFRYGQICVSIARDTFSPDLTGFISPRSLVYHIDTREEKCISTQKKKKERKKRGKKRRGRGKIEKNTTTRKFIIIIPQ